MNDSETNNETAINSKRTLLKALAGTGAAVALVPEQWSKPVLNSVSLPAHAQTTTGDQFGGAINDGLGSLDKPSGILDRLIQPAHAGHEPVGENFGNGCMLLTVSGSTISVLLQQSTGHTSDRSTTISEGKFSISIDGGQVNGEIDYTATGAVNNITGDVDGHRFMATKEDAAQCPEASLQGVNANCSTNLGDQAGWGSSFSLCFSATILNNDCDGATSMSYDVISGGTIIGHCGPNDKIGGTNPCFSCTLTSYSTLNGGSADSGESFTLDVTFDNGCRCSFVYGTWN